MDPNRWVNTIPFIGTKSNQEKYKLDSNKWINTLPVKKDNTLILSNAIHSNSNSNSNSNPNSKSSAGTKYSLTIIAFVIGLVLISVIKNGTRNIQKEISNLQASINNLKFNLDQAILDNAVITSPENISRLAKKHLNTNFIFYKKSQIKQFNEEDDTILRLDKKVTNKKNKNLSENIKSQVAKKIEKKKTEIRKLQQLYSKPQSIPGEIKKQVAQSIEEKKLELKNLYTTPKDIVTLQKAQKWAAVQVVKAFLGIPIVPGR